MRHTRHLRGILILLASILWIGAAAASSEEAEPAPRFRALLVGQQQYREGVNTVRTGCSNTLENLEALLNTARYEDGQTCAVQVCLDLDSRELPDAIASAFADAKEGDVSIFYISCHGFRRDGMTILQFVDGSVMAACDLEQELRKIPGTLVILADLCGSGGFIQSGESADALCSGFASAFGGEAASFAQSRYKVLTSAAASQNSYRLGYGESEGEIATVFAMALCDALGWNMQTRQKAALGADMDYDGKITLWEAYLYTARRVRWYLSFAGGGGTTYAQSVQVFPEGDGFVLFSR